MRKKGLCLTIALVVCLLVQMLIPLGVLAAGTYSIVDIVQLARTLAGIGGLSASELTRYDVNGDGTTNILDLALVAEDVLAGSSQNTTTTLVQAAPQPTVCPICNQYPCLGHQSQAAAQPTVCLNCHHYPCQCAAAGSSVSSGNAVHVCQTCHTYPCVCSTGSSTGSGWSSSGGSNTSSNVCGTCHSYPCVCSSNGHHYGTTSSGHHGSGHC